MKYRKAERIALDCEMVATGTNMRRDIVARVSLVNEDGAVVYDKYVEPTQEVTDYRTGITGITAATLEKGEPFKRVREEVMDLIKGKILVGHALENDFRVLQLEHPDEDILDTSRVAPYIHDSNNAWAQPALKFLARKYFNITFPTIHSSVKDAQVTMKLSHKPYEKMSQ